MTTTGVRPVTISGPTISVQSAVTVGAGLQLSTFAILGASEHGGVDVTDHEQSTVARAGVARRQHGRDGIGDRHRPERSNLRDFYIHALESVTGSANVTVSAPGFTGGSHAVDVVPSGIEIVNLNTATTTLSADDSGWYVQVGLPCEGNTQLCTVQNLRPGGPLFVVSLALAPAQTPIAQLRSDQPVATGQTVTKPIQPGIYYTQAIVGGSSYGLTFDPLAGRPDQCDRHRTGGRAHDDDDWCPASHHLGSHHQRAECGDGRRRTAAVHLRDPWGIRTWRRRRHDHEQSTVARAGVARRQHGRDGIGDRHRPERSDLRDLLHPRGRERGGLGECHGLGPGLYGRLACSRRRPDRYRDSQPRG